MSSMAAGPGAPFPPTIMFVMAMGVALGVHEQQPLAILDGRLLAWRTIAGAVPLAVGLAIFWWGLGSLARARTGIMLERPARQLVMSGPYRWSRNPQYVGFVACYLGLAVLWNSAWPLVFLPAVLLLLYALVIVREERYLRGVFGARYDEYCRRVRRWV